MYIYIISNTMYHVMYVGTIGSRLTSELRTYLDIQFSVSVEAHATSPLQESDVHTHHQLVVV